MKKISILVIALSLLVIAGVAYADSWLPEGVQHWTDECGYTCYVFPDGGGECYPCLQCEVTYETPTPPVTATPVDTPTPPPPPTDTPTPPNGKESCNRGLGNGSEDCDPGNSGGKPGSAGEDNE